MDGSATGSGAMRTAVLASILLILASLADSQTPPSGSISRSFMGFNLGDSIEEVKQDYKLEHAYVDRLRTGEEAREATPTPQEVDRVILRFLDGKLYEIGVYYTSGYSSELGWEAFISAAAQKYGSPQDEADDRVEWSDEHTSLLLTKSGRYRSYDGFGSMVTHFSAVYRDRPMADEASKRKIAIAPNF
jgi:hypothetical protein